MLKEAEERWKQSEDKEMSRRFVIEERNGGDSDSCRRVGTQLEIVALSRGGKMSIRDKEMRETDQVVHRKCQG